ncbi:MinD/ParA family ATP-binding protein [Zhihengliuella salsuginis]|uniref:MinD-like ATPase involved in chromosome partitioning or flagellar assembly n=1 Tax=Zhihengliuella salsuginis TaxID=578222 RepID=A0ABQ3GKL6_9MICC|nr:ATPase [Zhihengliuella salsuginis]GHD10063.1 hypothetical protein GCM10008096_23200 [Zhihengliuella salsuginis]
MAEADQQFQTRAELRRARQRVADEAGQGKTGQQNTSQGDATGETAAESENTAEDPIISATPNFRPQTDESPAPAAKRPLAAKREIEASLMEDIPLPRDGESTPSGGSASSEPSPPKKTTPAAPNASSPAAPRPAPATAAGSGPHDDDRRTFLRNAEQGDVPAQQGLRGFLNRLGFSLEPTGEELRDRQCRAQVGRRVGRPKTISIVNGKGGANKTPTTVLLASVFGRNSSQSVLAWDNNGTRGTLGWRTTGDEHKSHVMSLLDDADSLLSSKPTERSIDGYVHYQPSDRFSVLRTEPTLLAAEQSVSSVDFDSLYAVVSRYFQITFVDSGNDESAERWLRMIDHTDQLVIASTTVEEHAEAGALLLEALTNRGGRYAELARNAVVIVSEPSPSPKPGQLRRITRGFEHLARSVVAVPYDSHLVKGQIQFEALKPATKRAWLHAAAAVSDGLAD